MTCTCTIANETGLATCQRHGCLKSSHMVKLCQAGFRGESPGKKYLIAWEEGRGPGQRMPTPNNRKPPKEFPPLRDQVVSFFKAVGQWAGDGFRLVDEEEFNRRVGICMACPDDLFVRRSGRCRECGCCGKLKARGKVWACPKGHWGPTNV